MSQGGRDSSTIGGTTDTWSEVTGSMSEKVGLVMGDHPQSAVTYLLCGACPNKWLSLGVS